jgi:hypothetical protein
LKQRYESELAAERMKHQREMENLSRQKEAQAQALVSSMSPRSNSNNVSAYMSPPQGRALVPINNQATPRKSPNSGYKVTTKGTPKSYGNNSNDPNPTGFISPVTYNRKFDQLVGDMEVQSQVKVEEALREQRDRHADALERLVCEKDAEMALRLSEQARELERQHQAELNDKLKQVQNQAEEHSMLVLQNESVKMDQLIGEAEVSKINLEVQLVEARETFKNTLERELQAQRDAHAEEMRVRLEEAETRAGELRMAVLEEKDKMFQAEKASIESRLVNNASKGVEMEQKKFEAKLNEELDRQAQELREQAAQEKEEALLDMAKAHHSKLENVEYALKLQHTKSLAASMERANEEWEAERENIRLSIAQDHAEQLAKNIAAKEAEARARQDASISQQSAEHRAAVAAQLQAAEREHAALMRSQAAMLEEQHAALMEQALAVKEASHARILEQQLQQREEEHRKVMDTALRQQEAHHVERTQLLLEQYQNSSRNRTEEILKSKNMDHDEHILAIKEELSEGHRENLARELAHQREQLRRQYEAEKKELSTRLEEKRLKDLAEQAREHEEELENARSSVKGDHESAMAELEATWHARREEAVKVSARNLHDMHQEALRRALYDKDREMEETIERLTREKDAHQVEILQQLATQRDEEHHDRLLLELEAQEQEHKAIMDQLVKEKLDADKYHRDEILDMKEHISQLETKLHIDKSSAQQDVRRHGDRLGRFCDWVADQRIHVSVESSLGVFKQGTIQVLDSETGTATVMFNDGTEESAVSLSRISFKPVEIPPMMLGGNKGEGDESQEEEEVTDIWGIYNKMNSTERTLMFVMPAAVFPIVLVTLAILLKFVYAPL